MASQDVRMGAQRITSLTSIGDVLARVADLARPVAPREVALADAEGRVFARDIVAPMAWPAAAVALIDGWAVCAERIADAGPYTPVLLDAAPRWVDAGMPLPPEADAVLPPDAVTGAEVHAPATAAMACLRQAVTPPWTIRCGGHGKGFARSI